MQNDRDHQGFANASSAMKAGRIGEAISGFEACVARRPDDLKALCHLGICHLLNRSEKLFLQIYEEAKMLKARLRAVPEDVSRVFSQYEGLVKRVTATALMVGTVSTLAAGCVSSSAHKYSGGVNLPVDANDVGTETESVTGDTGLADTGSADTGSADTGTADTGTADTGSADTGTADTGSTHTAVSAHRYSAGVRFRTDTKR